MKPGRTIAGLFRAVVPAALVAALASCKTVHDPQTLKTGQFWPAHREAARQFAETQELIARQRALQLVGRFCDGKEPPGGLSAGAGTDEKAVREARAELCGPPTDAAVRGGVENAYKRWLEDDVRELPDPKDTGASPAAGES